VTGFRGAIATKRPLFESLFNMIATTRAKIEPLEAEVAVYADDIDGLRTLLDDPERKAKVWEAGTHRALYTDSASALLLLIDAEYDRFFYSTGIPMYASSMGRRKTPLRSAGSVIKTVIPYVPMDPAPATANASPRFAAFTKSTG